MKAFLKFTLFAGLFVFFVILIKEILLFLILHEPVFKSEILWTMRMTDEYITHSTQRRINRLDSDLRDKDPEIRADAVVFLGNRQFPKKVQLLAELAEDPVFQVRMEATKALGKTADPEALNALLTKLDDDNKMIRQSAVESLGELAKRRLINPVAVKKLLEQGGELEVEKALAEMYDEVSIQIMAEKLRKGNDNERTGAARAFLRMSDLDKGKFVPFELVLASLKDRNTAVRLAAVQTVGNLTYKKPKSPEVLRALTSGSRDEDDEVAFYSFYALEQGELTPEIIDTAFSVIGHKDPRIRKRAIIVLARSGEPDVVKPLLDRMNDEHFDVRAAAARAFTKIKDPRSIDPLIRLALKDQYWDVADPAADALKNQGGDRAMEAVRRHDEQKAAWLKKR